MQNIINVFDQASPGDIEAGMVWYPQARGACLGIARGEGITLRQAAGIVAALSPRTPWSRNLSAARKFIRGEVGEGTGANKAKAAKILAGHDPEVILRGPKVTSFFANIINPNDPEHVTIDVWAIRIDRGPETWGQGYPSTPTPKQYWEIASRYREAAGRLGLVPSELQAITWTTIRRLCGKT